MSITTPSELALLDPLWDWYWQYGRQRRGQYELRLSDWGDKLSRLRLLRDLTNHSTSQGKPAMALWGPSQTGKSTLISNDVDAGAGPRGEDSALHWPGGTPARFVAKDPDLREVVVLNPFAFGSDASGCVTRFSLAQRVTDPQYPVELRLAPPEQLLHAIAMGYLSECRTEQADGRKTKFDEDRYNQLLDDWRARQQSPGTVSREAFDKLCRLLDLLEILVLSGEDRYENLSPCLAAIRRQSLDHPVLTANSQNVDAFAAELLWDGRSELTKLFNELSAKARDLRQRWGGKPVLCSLQVAALLLDIDSYQKLKKATGEVARVRELARKLSYSVDDSHVRVGIDLPRPLVAADEDFGLLQGLVMELVVPLRHEVLQRESPEFFAFLEAADLLDFPGVALSHENTVHTRLDLERLTGEQRVKLYTEVLKRGKTASIVASYARNLTIDGFSVLTRINRFPAQPAQLLTGINTWWRCFDPGFRSRDLTQRSPLPLNLVLTFCAELVGPVVQAGVRDGLDPVFKRLRQLGPLSDPGVITNTLATNYPQFHDGRLPSDNNRVIKAVQDIMADPSFQRQFATSAGKESFRNAIDNGGTAYVFKVLRDQATVSRRVQLLTDRQKTLRETLRTLVEDALPLNANAGEQRRRSLLKWQAGLKDALRSSRHEDPVEQTSLVLREVFHVEHSKLDPVPSNLGRLQQRSIREYVLQQFDRWITSVRESESINRHLADIGLADSSELSRLLHHVVGSVDISRIVRWMQDNLPTLTGHNDLRIHRRYVAHLMVNELLGAASDGASESHPTEEEIRQDIDRYVEQALEEEGDVDASPHYHRVVRPIFDMLHRVAESGVPGQRQPQPGDAELELLLQRFPLGGESRGVV
jgi:hypothetical protein